LEIPLGDKKISLNGKVILIQGDYSKVFPLAISLLRISGDCALLFLDDFNTRVFLSEVGYVSRDELSKIMVSKFENLIQLDKALEQSEKILLNRKSFKILLIGSLPNAYLREISLHDASSHSNILYLLNKILAFFSFLSKEYDCTGILISPSRSLDYGENAPDIPAKRIFLYWVDYLLELRKCSRDMFAGRLKTRSGDEVYVCLPMGNIKELGEIRICKRDECQRSV